MTWSAGSYGADFLKSCIVAPEKESWISRNVSLGTGVTRPGTSRRHGIRNLEEKRDIRSRRDPALTLRMMNYRRLRVQWT